MDGEERVTVSTYVPAYQRDAWREHADELGMSQAEFVRSMVQAGRRKFAPDVGETNGDTSPGEGGSPGATPGVDGLENRLLDLLREEEVLDWDELVTELTGDLEHRIEEALDTLQDDNRVRHRPRQGGYALVDNGE